MEKNINLKNRKAGLSLIVLIITILVIIVLSTATIITTVVNNPVDQAVEVVFKSDMKSALEDFKIVYANSQMNSSQNLTDEDLKNRIESIRKNDYYKKILLVEYDTLYILEDQVENNIHVTWAEEVGIEVKRSKKVPEIKDVTLTQTTNTIEATVSIIDSISKVKEYTYYISTDGVNFSSVMWLNNKYTFIGLKSNTKYYVKVSVKDNEGNSATSEIVSTVTTGISGNITFVDTPKLGEGVYTNQNINLEIVYPLQPGMINKVSIDGGKTFKVYTGPITITNNTTTIYALTEDMGGQQGETKTWSTSKIDKIVPNRFTPIVTDENTNTLKITGTAVDGAATSDNASSGIRGYQYRIDDGAWTAETTTNSYIFSGLSNTKTYKMSMRAIDKAGNVGAEESVTKQIASASGSITYSPNPNVGNGLYTNQNVVVTITYPEIAGTTKKVSTNGGTTWSVYTGPITITQNTTINTLIDDSVGNSVMTGQYVIDKIDKKPPSVPVINYNSGSNVCAWLNNINIGLTSTDSQSGILRYETDYNGDSISDGIVANPYIPANSHNSDNNRFRSIDKAGNASEWSNSVHIHMDTQAPVVNSFTYTVTSDSITITGVNVSENIGIGTYIHSIAGIWSNSPGISVPMVTITGLTANTTYNVEVTAKDHAGNIGKKIISVTTSAPPIPYDRPYIPNGFEHVTGGWNAGFVIRDKTLGNEFVWIPVKNISELVKTKFDDSFPPGGVFVRQDIRDSIAKYGGFYRSRYEIGKGNVSAKGNEAWRYIYYSDAELVAREMYNTSEIGTKIQYGETWDVTCLWLQSTGYNIYNSSTWGNYKDSTYPANVTGYGKIQTTGYSEHWKANNIYDMAGNLREWTSDMTTDGHPYFRGYAYYDNGSSGGGVTSRVYYPVIDAKLESVGFSTILYKKN